VIAKTVVVQPRIVSHWRHRFPDEGLAGLEDKPRPGKKPIYTKATGKRIPAQLAKPPPEGFARWTRPLPAGAPGDVDVQYVWRFLREHKFDLSARNSWCESNDPEFTAKAADVVGLMSILLQKPLSCASMRSHPWSAHQGYQRTRLDWLKSRLQAPRHAVRRAPGCHGNGHRGAFKASPHSPGCRTRSHS
jgi:transposase